MRPSDAAALAHLAWGYRRDQELKRDTLWRYLPRGVGGATADRLLEAKLIVQHPEGIPRYRITDLGLAASPAPTGEQQRLLP